MPRPDFRTNLPHVGPERSAHFAPVAVAGTAGAQAALAAGQGHNGLWAEGSSFPVLPRMVVDPFRRGSPRSDEWSDQWRGPGRGVWSWRCAICSWYPVVMQLCADPLRSAQCLCAAQAAPSRPAPIHRLVRSNDCRQQSPDGPANPTVPTDGIRLSLDPCRACPRMSLAATCAEPGTRAKALDRLGDDRVRNRQ